jgi:hypothetical protein
MHSPWLSEQSVLKEALHLQGESKPRVGLMFWWAGNAYDALLPPALEEARLILEELHGLGVVHGDVKFEPQCSGFIACTRRQI